MRRRWFLSATAAQPSPPSSSYSTLTSRLTKQRACYGGEKRRQHSGEPYREIVNPGPNRVLIKTITTAFDGVDTALYVDFPAEGKLQNPSPELLAKSAIASAAARVDGLDRISYLISA